MSDSENDVTESYCVLSIDGGGFKGLACLLILEHLMKVVSGENDEDNPPPKPCQVFDLICGASTGGLIAILLGRLGLSCQEAIEVYKELGETMFGGESDSGKIWGNIIKDGQFSSSAFEKKLEDVVTKYTGSKDALLRTLKSAPDPIIHDSTKTFVTIVSKIGAAGVDAYRVRSYQCPIDEIDPSPRGHRWSILEAARGTCATPLYFSPLKIQHGHATYVYQDAGYSGFNNPAKVAIDEANSVFDTDEITLISLGTGLRSLVEDGNHQTGTKKEIKEEDVDHFSQKILGTVKELGKNIVNATQLAKRVAKQLLEVATDTEISHLRMYEEFKRKDQRERYHRFNPPQGLGDVDLTDFRQEATISFVTDAWLKSSAGKRAISSAATNIKERYELKQAISDYGARPPSAGFVTIRL